MVGLNAKNQAAGLQRPSAWWTRILVAVAIALVVCGSGLLDAKLYGGASISFLFAVLLGAIFLSGLSQKYGWPPKRTNLIIVTANFIVTWIVAFWGLRLPALQMPAAFSFAMGLIVASFVALFCAYAWQYKVFRQGKLSRHLGLACTAIILAFVCLAFGFRVGNNSILKLFNFDHLARQNLWMEPSWIGALVISSAVAYVELWTLLRRLVDRREW